MRLVFFCDLEFSLRISNYIIVENDLYRSAFLMLDNLPTKIVLFLILPISEKSPTTPTFRIIGEPRT